MWNRFESNGTARWVLLVAGVVCCIAATSISSGCKKEDGNPSDGSAVRATGIDANNLANTMSWLESQAAAITTEMAKRNKISEDQVRKQFAAAVQSPAIDSISWRLSVDAVDPEWVQIDYLHKTPNIPDTDIGGTILRNLNIELQLVRPASAYAASKVKPMMFDAIDGRRVHVPEAEHAVAGLWLKVGDDISRDDAAKLVAGDVVTIKAHVQGMSLMPSGSADWSMPTVLVIVDKPIAVTKFK